MEPMELGSDDESPPSTNVRQGRGWEPALTTVQGAVAFKRAKYGQNTPHTRAMTSKKENTGHQTPTQKSVSSRRTKTGYGLPDEETLFAHFPEYTKQPSSSSSAQHRIKTEDLSDSNNASDDTIEDSKGRRRVYKSSSASSKIQPENCTESQGICSKCFLIVLLLFIAVVVALILMSPFQIHMCEQSRQFDKRVLEMDLESIVFGQHIATKLVSNKIDEYFHKFAISDIENESNSAQASLEVSAMCKPLVLSFHGWTGVGKNYVSKIVSDSFKYSKNSGFIIPFHFPHKAFEDVYRQQIHQWIVGNYSQCLTNIIIIDEMDKASPAVVEGIADAINALAQSCSTAGPTLFFLLSNTYANDINRVFLQFMSDSSKYQREQLTLDQFSAIFSEKSDAWFSKLAQNDLLDAFVPFLPLEKRHVIQCIKRDLVAKRFSTDSVTVDRVLKELSFSTFGDLQLSTTGCKRVADKVDYIMYDKKSEL